LPEYSIEDGRKYRLFVVKMYFTCLFSVAGEVLLAEKASMKRKTGACPFPFHTRSCFIVFSFPGCLQRQKKEKEVGNTPNPGKGLRPLRSP
jgi:hypothetical protein